MASGAKFQRGNNSHQYHTNQGPLPAGLKQSWYFILLINSYIPLSNFLRTQILLYYPKGMFPREFYGKHYSLKTIDLTISLFADGKESNICMPPNEDSNTYLIEWG